jgi:hypothetical protein
MSNLSLREFKKMCDSLSFKQFIFSSDNQSWSKIEHTIKMDITFTVMMIAIAPDTICLKDKNSLICLDRVKRIITSDIKSVLGTVFSIVCGDLDSDLNDVTYTIVAR